MKKKLENISINQHIEKYDSRGRGFYKQFEIRAVAKLHKVALSIIKELKIPNPANILELGAGTGAFSVRLKDNGFNVECIDIKTINLESENITSHQIDLNSKFSQGFLKNSFAIITCLEVIEHLENPFVFFQECNKILTKGNYLLLSTPNVESWIGRLLFLYTGRLAFFGHENYHSMRHISPQFSWNLPLIAKESGFSLIKTVSTENKFTFYAGPNNLFLRIFKLFLFIIIYPFMKGNKKGDVTLFLFQKN